MAYPANLASSSPSPIPPPTQILIYNLMILSYPPILGSEISGTVMSLGSAVTEFRVGDRVGPNLRVYL